MMQNCDFVSDTIILVEIYAMEHLYAQAAKLYDYKFIADTTHRTKSLKEHRHNKFIPESVLNSS
jgi:hypothetical protein